VLRTGQEHGRAGGIQRDFGRPAVVSVSENADENRLSAADGHFRAVGGNVLYAGGGVGLHVGGTQPGGAAAVALRHRRASAGVFPEDETDPARISCGDVFGRDVAVIDVKLRGSPQCGRKLLDQLVLDAVGDRSHAGRAQLQCALQPGQSGAQRRQRVGVG